MNLCVNYRLGLCVVLLVCCVYLCAKDMFWVDLVWIVMLGWSVLSFVVFVCGVGGLGSVGVVFVWCLCACLRLHLRVCETFQVPVLVVGDVYVELFLFVVGCLWVTFSSGFLISSL